MPAMGCNRTFAVSECSTNRLTRLTPINVFLKAEARCGRDILDALRSPRSAGIRSNTLRIHCRLIAGERTATIEWTNFGILIDVERGHRRGPEGSDRRQFLGAADVPVAAFNRPASDPLASDLRLGLQAGG